MDPNETVQRELPRLPSDGKPIDLSGLDESQIGALAHSFRATPELQKQDGTVVLVVPGPVVDAFYATIGNLESWLAEKRGLPREIAIRLWTYTPHELEQLREPTQAVLSKHAGTFLSKWGEETSLAFLLLTLHQQKLSAMAELMPKPAPVAPAKPNGQEAATLA